MPDKVDLEQAEGGKDEDEEEQMTEKDWDVVYHVTFVLAIAVFGIGVLELVVGCAKSWIVHLTLGWGCLITGVFLLINVDVLVTFVRLIVEVERFKENNKKNRAILKEQKKKVEELKETEDMMTKFTALAGGQVETLDEVLGEMQATSGDTVKATLRQLFFMQAQKLRQLGKSRPSDVQQGNTIPTGPILDQAFDTFHSVYVRAFPDLEQRMEELKKVIEASEYIAKKQRVTDSQLSGILHLILFTEVPEIKEKGDAFMVEEERLETENDAWLQAAA